MVLQRAPQAARLYGFDALDLSAEAFLSCSLEGALLPLQRAPLTYRSHRSSGSPLQAGEQDGSPACPCSWEVELPPQAANTICDISIMYPTQPAEATLTGVIFGDVYLCSGQSNMVFKMKQIFNSTEELAASAGFTDIRFTVLQLTTSDVELEDIEPKIPWSDPSQSGLLESMSAVCFLYARNLYSTMLARGERLPLGLVASAWGGTRIEAWSTPSALQACGSQEVVDTEHPEKSNSYLWNANIAPLRRMALFGFLWYQGEANGNFQRDLYSCTFPALIDSWREEFEQPDAPFGFVQLSTIQYGNAGLSYPILRNHQTADYGKVPNPRMPGTFMAVAVDTYDQENGIHPRFKQVIGERLAIAGMKVAYGQEDFPSSGPGITDLFVSESGFLLFYDEPFTYDDSELTGFYYCCGPLGFCSSNTNAGNWPALAQDEVEADVAGGVVVLALVECEEEGDMVSLAYLWRQTPIETPVWGAPIYSADGFRLPSAPWIMSDVPT